jgi:hypothetical protein
MKQPKQIPDPDKAVKFVCPDCGDTRLEAVMDGHHTTIILGMFKSGSIEYGETQAEGDLQRYSCVTCNFSPMTEFDDEEHITDDEQVVEWCKDNCKQ